MEDLKKAYDNQKTITKYEINNIFAGDLFYCYS